MNGPTAKRNLSRAAVAASCLPLLAVLTACPGPDVSRDLSDATGPSLSLSVAGSKDDPAFVAVPDGGRLELTRAESAVVVATAADDGGVSRVELWVGTDETCHLPGGLASGGPGSLVTKPRAFTDAAISATEAPSRLSTTVTLGNQQVRANCTVTYRVCVVGYNAASTPVSTRGRTARLTVPATFVPA